MKLNVVQTISAIRAPALSSAVSV